MKYLDNEIVKPFVGIGNIKLGMNYDDAIKVYKKCGFIEDKYPHYLTAHISKLL